MPGLEAAKETAIGREVDDLYERPVAAAKNSDDFDVHKMMLDDGDYLDATHRTVDPAKRSSQKYGAYHRESSLQQYGFGG